MTTNEANPSELKNGSKGSDVDWWAECCVCGIAYPNHAGSTPCCGSLAEIIEGEIPAPARQPATVSPDATDDDIPF